MVPRLHQRGRRVVPDVAVKDMERSGSSLPHVRQHRDCVSISSDAGLGRAAVTKIDVNTARRTRRNGGMSWAIRFMLIAAGLLLIAVAVTQLRAGKFVFDNASYHQTTFAASGIGIGAVLILLAFCPTVTGFRGESLPSEPSAFVAENNLAQLSMSTRNLATKPALWYQINIQVCS
jgi:hypothetical protein